MKWLNLITLLLVIVGGVNWLLVGIGGYEMDLVANIGGGVDGAVAKVVYILVGLSALYQLLPLFRSLGRGETSAQANR